jgi:hypothetical protein
VTVTRNIRFCADQFDRLGRFERFIVVNRAEAMADSISIFRSDRYHDHQKLHRSAGAMPVLSPVNIRFDIEPSEAA